MTVSTVLLINDKYIITHVKKSITQTLLQGQFVITVLDVRLLGYSIICPNTLDLINLINLHVCSTLCFKKKLHLYLSTIPDVPNTPNLSNSLILHV